MRYIYFPTLTIRWVVISSVLAFCTGLLGASPQSVRADTSIFPTGGTGSPASLGTVITPGSAPTGLCTVNCVITGGTRAGSNLFHSFGEFSVGLGDTATFLNDSSLATDNILGRVTGGIRSDIFGMIQTSNFGNANLFLINPAGFLFGPGATINIGGMVSFTSADYLKSADGARFNVVPSPIDDALLSAEPVAAFGFLGSNPGAITVQGSQFVVTSGQSISLVGGNITIEADPDSGTPSYLSAPSGQINLVSVAAAGEVSTTEFLPGNGMVMGNILLAQGATVDASGDPGGTVRIRGGQFEMDQAYIFAGSSGDIHGATTAISIKATGDVLVRNQSNVDVTGFGAGRTGNIEIEARSLMLTDGSIIANQGIGSAPAGNISLMIEQSLTMERMDSFGNGSLLQTFNAGSGTGGNITLTPLNAQTSPNVTIADSGKILTSAGGQSAASDITMQVANLTLRSGASIQTFGATDAPSGNIHVNATGDVSLIGQGDFTTRIVSQNSDAGGTGWIKIQSENLSLTDKAQILSETASLPGSPPPTDPKVLLTATDSVTVAGGSRIDLSNNASSVGSLDIHAANTITISDLGLLNTSTIGSGDAGAINITAGTVSMTGGGQINSSTQENGVTGNGGAISVVASGDISLTGSATNSFGEFIQTAIQSSSLVNSQGNGGNIALTAGQSVTISNGASVSASSTGPGNAGDISINAGQSLDLRDSSIKTEAAQASGGNIDIQAVDRIRLVDSTISTSVLGGGGSGGNITIDPNIVVLQNSNVIAQAVQGAGGNITITTPLFLADQTSLVSASSQFGLNGTVTIQSPTSNLSGSLGTLASKTQQAQSLVTQRCAALVNGQASSFVVAGREQLPADPGSWLSSPIALAGIDTDPFRDGTVAESASHLAPRTSGLLATDRVSLRRLTPARFLMANFADSEATGCHS